MLAQERVKSDGHKSIIGPFNFEDTSAANRIRQKVAHTTWTLLNMACDNAGMLPPTFGSKYTQQINRQRPGREKFRNKSTR